MLHVHVLDAPFPMTAVVKSWHVDTWHARDYVCAWTLVYSHEGAGGGGWGTWEGHFARDSISCESSKSIQVCACVFLQSTSGGLQVSKDLFDPHEHDKNLRCDTHAHSHTSTYIHTYFIIHAKLHVLSHTYMYTHKHAHQHPNVPIHVFLFFWPHTSDQSTPCLSLLLTTHLRSKYSVISKDASQLESCKKKPTDLSVAVRAWVMQKDTDWPVRGCTGAGWRLSARKCGGSLQGDAVRWPSSRKKPANGWKLTWQGRILFGYAALLFVSWSSVLPSFLTRLFLDFMHTCTIMCVFLCICNTCIYGNQIVDGVAMIKTRLFRDIGDEYMDYALLLKEGGNKDMRASWK